MAINNAELKINCPNDPQQSKTLCSEHPDSVLNMYCVTCNFSVCTKCIMGKHNEHQCEKLVDIAKQKHQELDRIFSQVKKDRLNNLTRSLEKVLQNQKEYTEKFDQLFTEIQIKAEEMKEEIDKIKDQFINELTKKREEDLEHMRKLQVQVETELKQLRMLLQESEEKLKEADDIDVITIFNHFNIFVSQDMPVPVVLLRYPPAFLNCQVHHKNLENLFGELVYVNERRKSSLTIVPNIQSNILYTFRCDEYIHAIHTINAHQAWFVTRVGIWGTKFHRFDKTGNCDKIIYTNGCIEDMATTQNGDILATEAGIYVRKISEDGRVEDFADVSPYKACGIHVTCDGDIIVSLKHGSSQPGMIKKGRVIRLTSNGQIHQVIENDRIKFNVYTSKIRITENINGDIWIMEEFNQCIMVLDKYGKYKFTYKGPPEKEMWEEFIPYDISHDHYGNVLVADCHNKTIHLVNKKGKFVQYIELEQENVYHPSSLIVDCEGKLWVGCNCGKVFIMNYLSTTRENGSVATANKCVS